jgi:type IV pilus assembly protein PilZ
MEKPHPAARMAPRLEYELPVAYRTVSGFVTDWAVNISRGGLFINTQKPLPVGTGVRLIISLPGTDFPFDLTGRVTRVNESHGTSNQVPGMAIEFVDVDDEKRSRIEAFVNRLRQELPLEEGGVNRK